jgi:hypothetical protein
LTISLPICIPFIFSCLNALARNRSGKNGTLVSFLTLGEMVSVFLH